MSKIVVEFLGDTSRLTNSFNTVGTSAAKFETSMSSVAKAAVAAGAGFLAAQMSIGALENGVRSVLSTYQTFEKQTLQMTAAVRSHGESLASVTTQLEANRAQYASWGLSLADVRPAITKMTEAGMAQADVFAALPAIIDLARAKNIDLVSASDLVSRAVNGQARGLLDLGIKLPTATFALDALGTVSLSAADKASRLATVTQAVTAATGDQTTAVDELDTKQAALANRWEDLSLKVGPGLETLLGDLADAAINAADAFDALGTAVGNVQTGFGSFPKDTHAFANEVWGVKPALDAETSSLWAAYDALEAYHSAGGLAGAAKSDLGAPESRQTLRPPAPSITLPGVQTPLTDTSGNPLVFPDLTKATGGASAAAAAVAAAAAKMKSSFTDAFDTAKAHVNAMFDALHSRNLKAIDDAKNAANAILTAQQKALQEPVTAAQAALNARYAAEQLTSLQEAVSNAQMGGDPRAMQQAQQALTDYVDQQTVDRMQTAATEAIDKLETQKTANDALAKDQTDAENKRHDAQVAAFDKEMTNLDKHLGDTKAAYAQSYADLANLYGDYLKATGKALSPSESAAQKKLQAAAAGAGPVPASIGAGAASGAMPVGGINLTVNVTSSDPDTIAKSIMLAVTRELGRQGMSWA